MNPFVQVPRDVIEGHSYRETLLAQPDEFFHPLFGNRSLSLEERLYYVEQMVARSMSSPIFMNDVYRVEVASKPPFIHLDIRRRDGQPGKCWRDFQEIKNQLVGPEYEAVELFPAESRLVDTSNQYHLWVHVDPEFRFPMGFAVRFVLEEPLRYQTRPTVVVAEEPKTVFSADSSATSVHPRAACAA